MSASVNSGYLLDNNIISLLARPQDPSHGSIKARLRALQGSPVFLPVIAIAEIEFGMAKAVAANPTQREALHRFFVDYPLHLPIDDNTVEPYALIRAQVWHNHGTPKGRGHKEKLPEELTDRVTGESLGIDERDLLIASTAAQYGLTLITNDSNEGMRRIEKAAQDLEMAGKPIRLRIDRWPQVP